MRFLKLLCIMLMAMLISAAFLSCSKSDDISQDVTVNGTPVPGTSSGTPSLSITGLWSGKYFGQEKSIPVYFGFRIKEKDKLEVLNAQKKQIGAGTWVLTGNSFKATYTLSASGKLYSFSGELFSAPDRLIGTWGYDDSMSDGGIWDIAKH